jgi:UPF0042 nucleotide-binding protein
VQIVVLTGMSGAGRTAALRVFEDLGWFGVDNLPPPLLAEFAARCVEQGDIPKAAVVMDTRAGRFFDSLPDAIGAARALGYDVEVFFLDATDDVLIRRFKETRRHHPLDGRAGSVAEGIRLERAELAPVREMSDSVLDTSHLSSRQLASIVHDRYGDEGGRGGLSITVVSFGFKHGLPEDADLVFDVRFLRNPYWEPSLRNGTGRDPAVRAYIDADPRTAAMLEHVGRMLEFAVPCYVEEGKAYLTIAIGCTGGRHRSVYLAETIAASLRGLGYRAGVRHRELDRDDQAGGDAA